MYTGGHLALYYTPPPRLDPAQILQNYSAKNCSRPIALRTRVFQFKICAKLTQDTCVLVCPRILPSVHLAIGVRICSQRFIGCDCAQRESTGSVRLVLSCNYLRPDHSETRGVRGKGACDAGYPRANTNRTEGLVKEGKDTWPMTLSRSEVVKPDGRSRVRSLRLKGKPERDSN